MKPALAFILESGSLTHLEQQGVHHCTKVLIRHDLPAEPVGRGKPVRIGSAGKVRFQNLWVVWGKDAKLSGLLEDIHLQAGFSLLAVCLSQKSQRTEQILSKNIPGVRCTLIVKPDRAVRMFPDGRVEVCSDQGWAVSAPVQAPVAFQPPVGTEAHVGQHIAPVVADSASCGRQPGES